MIRLLSTLAGAALAACLAIVARIVVARDRRTIADDLHARRCKLVRARWAWTRHRPGHGRPYDVEYTDPEDGTAATTCIVSKHSVAWGDDFADDRKSSLVFASDLPTYGQNWRG